MDSKYVDEVIDEDEIPELTDEDFARMVPFSELPAEVQRSLRAIGQRDAIIRPDEEKLSVPVLRSVVEWFRAARNDWQAEVERVLRKWLDRQKAS